MKNTNTAAGAKTPRSKRRFNFIDVLIILAIVLLGAIVVNLFLPEAIFKSSKNTTREIQYTVEFVGVDEAFIDKIKENDNAIDSVSKYSVGKVILVDRNTLYSELQYDEENHAGKFAVYEDKYNVLVTISVMADYHEGEGYSVGGKRIAVGEKFSLRLSDYAGEGYCINLSAAQ